MFQFIFNISSIQNQHHQRVPYYITIVKALEKITCTLRNVFISLEFLWNKDGKLVCDAEN